VTDIDHEALYRRPRDRNSRGLFVAGPQWAQLVFWYLVVTYCREAPLTRESALAQQQIRRNRADRWRREYESHDMHALVRRLQRQSA
jgi:hypothetical protein